MAFTDKFNEVALRTPEGVTELMASSADGREWNKNVAAVQKANGGYPSFWPETVIASGLLDRTAAKWPDATVTINMGPSR